MILLDLPVSAVIIKIDTASIIDFAQNEFFLIFFILWNVSLISNSFLQATFAVEIFDILHALLISMGIGNWIKLLNFSRVIAIIFLFWGGLIFR